MMVFIPAKQDWICDLNCSRCKGRGRAECLVIGNGLTMYDAIATSLKHGVFMHQFMKPKDVWQNRLVYEVPQDDAVLFEDTLKRATDRVH